MCLNWIHCFGVQIKLIVEVYYVSGKAGSPGTCM